MDYSLPGSSVHEILQARILKWVFPYPGDLPKPGIKPGSPAFQVDSLPSEPPVHWLRFHAPNTGGHGLIPELGTRSHVL